MKYINYQTLVNTMRVQKPYRGTTNRFPLGNRKQSYKYFLKDTDENGEEILRIIYGKFFKTDEATEEMYDADPTNIHKSVYNENGIQHIKYYKYTELPNEMGIVRPDNSFEFTGQRYGQGEMTFLSSLTPYREYFKRDCKRGGMLYVGNRTDSLITMMPIFRNLRVDCDTMKPDPKHRYEIVGRRVNRKESKEFLKQYEDFFKVSEVMMSNMTLSSFAEVCREKLDEIDGYTNRSGYFLYRYNCLKIVEHAMTIMNDAPVDAAALFCIGMGSRGVDDFRYVVGRSHRNTDDDTTFAEKYFTNMKRLICELLYENAPDVFAKVPFEFGKVFPQSSWGYQVYVDDVLVLQY